MAPPPMDDSKESIADDPASRDAFSNRVAVSFVTQILTAGLGIFNGVILARLIGPSGKGEYYLLTLLPPTLMVLGQLGMPQAFAFFAARGQTRGLVRQAIILTGAVSIPILLVTLMFLPIVQSLFPAGMAQVAIVAPLLALPLLLSSTLTTAIVVGRQAVRWLALVNICFSLSATGLILLLVGALGLGVGGALIAFIATTTLQAVGFLIGAIQVSRTTPSSRSVSFRDLFRRGLPFYPGSLTQFFGYRIDVYLLAWLLAEPSAPLGYYSLAVSMAELMFFFPNAVSTFFFPHVAGLSPEASARQVPLVSRVTLILTIVVGLVLAPVATLAIFLVLPAFGPSLAPLFILLPGVVAVSISKVLGGYVSGLGRSGLNSFVNIVTVVSNVALNIVLIPTYGIVGAALASLVSYSLSSAMYSVIAGRLAGVAAIEFWIPRPADVRFATATAIGLVRRISQRVGRG